MLFPQAAVHTPGVRTNSPKAGPSALQWSAPPSLIIWMLNPPAEFLISFIAGYLVQCGEISACLFQGGKPWRMPSYPTRSFDRPEVACAIRQRRDALTNRAVPSNCSKPAVNCSMPSSFFKIFRCHKCPASGAYKVSLSSL